MCRMTMTVAALLIAAMTASCSGVGLRVLGVNVPSMTRERVQENPADRDREPSGFPPRCHRGPEEPTGPSPAPETCED
jgi:hypothetical protein